MIRPLIKCWIAMMLISSSALAQHDTLSIMYYNLLDFPSGGSTRVDTLKKIIAYTDPDIFIVNELESLFGANAILAGSMNADGVTKYASATFYSGPDTQNLLFYNTEKVGLKSQTQITTSLRDISEYEIYYKAPNLGSGVDTIFIYAYGCHLKAGNQANDESQRNSEALSLKNYLDAKGRSGNIIVGGDFNIYTSSESACQTILNTGNVKLKDPLNKLGGWHNTGFYSDIHTQSTRTSTGFAGGASGGMDDRFDIMFCTDQVLNGALNVKYVPNSYIAVGQDGNKFNGNVNDGVNTSVPADIANALFYMSDHLPVYMELAIDAPNSISEQDNIFRSYNLSSLGDLSLYFTGNSQKTILIYDLAGNLVYKGLTTNDRFNTSIAHLQNGIYITKVISNNRASSVKLFWSK